MLGLSNTRASGTLRVALIGVCLGLLVEAQLQPNRTMSTATTTAAPPSAMMPPHSQSMAAASPTSQTATVPLPQNATMQGRPPTPPGQPGLPPSAQSPTAANPTTMPGAHPALHSVAPMSAVQSSTTGPLAPMPGGQPVIPAAHSATPVAATPTTPLAASPTTSHIQAASSTTPSAAAPTASPTTSSVASAAATPTPVPQAQTHAAAQQPMVQQGSSAQVPFDFSESTNNPNDVTNGMNPAMEAMMNAQSKDEQMKISVITTKEEAAIEDLVNHMRMVPNTKLSPEQFNTKEAFLSSLNMEQRTILENKIKMLEFNATQMKLEKAYMASFVSLRVKAANQAGFDMIKKGLTVEEQKDYDASEGLKGLNLSPEQVKEFKKGVEQYLESPNHQAEAEHARRLSMAANNSNRPLFGAYLRPLLIFSIVNIFFN